MKQFNLEEYLANPSKKLVTRDGRNVRIICTDRLAEYPVVALLYYEENEGDSHEKIASYTIKGQFNPGFENPLDLFFAPEKMEGWLNIYENNYLDSIIYPSEEEALNMIDRDMKYITTIKIELEE